MNDDDLTTTRVRSGRLSRSLMYIQISIHVYISINVDMNKDTDVHDFRYLSMVIEVKF